VLAAPGPWNGTLYGGVAYSAASRALEFDGVSGFVDLGDRFMDGINGITLSVLARVDAPAAAKAIPYARLFEAGGGCVAGLHATEAARPTFDCSATSFYLGTGVTGTTLIAGGSSRQTYAVGAPGVSVRSSFPPCGGSGRG
jgi:hypothetical protein